MAMPVPIKLTGPHSSRDFRNCFQNNRVSWVSYSHVVACQTYVLCSMACYDWPSRSLCSWVTYVSGDITLILVLWTGISRMKPVCDFFYLVPRVGIDFLSSGQNNVQQ